MARDFTKNTANYMNLPVGTIGNLINGAAAVSLHAWVFADTFDTGTNDNRILNTFINMNGVGPILMISGSAGAQKVRLFGRSVITDAGQSTSGATTVSTGQWVAAGGVFDFTGDALRVYLNGTQDANTAVTFLNNTYTMGTATVPDTIGKASDPPAGTPEQFDGRIAEVAVWKVDIGTAGFLMLANGFSPVCVAPASLVSYLPLIGGYSPEIDVRSGAVATITGTVAAAAHPRVLMPTPRTLRKWTSAAAAARPLFRHPNLDGLSAAGSFFADPLGG